ncbi:MAG: FHA domain-containing protein [Polyangiales bacterium]
MALLVYLQDKPGQPARILAFERSPVRIGRNPLNDLTIDHAFVSQWHAQLRFEGMEVTIMDLGSTNGSAINGHRLPSQQNIRVGGPTDEIQLGPIRLQLNFGPASMATEQVGRASMDGRGLKAATMMLGAKTAVVEADGPSHANPAKLLEMVVGTVDAVRPGYAQYRQAWAGVLQQVKAQLDRLPVDARPAAVRAMVRAMPQLSSEPELEALLREYQIDTGEFILPEPRAWLARLAGRPDTAKNEVNVGVAMERVGALLEAFSESYVELRKGMESFGADIGLQLASTDSMLHKAQSQSDVLAYLLEWRGDGAERVDNLRRSFVDVALHQVAMLSGVMAGTRALLKEVSPDTLASGSSSSALAVKPPLWTRLLPFGGAAKWSRFKAAHRSLVEEDRFSRLLFGREFARAYYAVSGNATESSP